MISPQALNELKNLYFKHYRVMLDDQQVLDLEIKLVNLFKIIARPIPKVDKQVQEVKNKNNG